MSYKTFGKLGVVTTLWAALATSARAVPYASGVRNTSGANWEFVLNEAADNVTVLRNGANPVNLGSLTAGRHTFDMTGFTDFDIQVSKSAPVGWTSISDPTNLFANFVIPGGVAINTDPASPYFGTVYVASSSGTTERGRTVGEGLYSLTADMKGVDLANNFAVVANANDTTQAKAPGFTADATTTASPWRIALDEAGNVIVSDWSDPAGGIKYASANLTTGGLILAGEGDTSQPTVHGSISSKPYVTGSVGNNLTVTAIDEDLFEWNSVRRWDVGSATNYAQPPSVVIDGFALESANPESRWIATVNGTRLGAHYSPQHDKWYLVQNRDTGNEAGIFVVEADGVDGLSPNLLWDSLSFTRDPNGDLNPSDALDGNTGVDGNQDIFRNIGDVTLSPDGTKLLVHRIASRVNPFQAGGIIVIPLDENGVPDIQVSAGALANVETITTIGQNLAHSSGAQLEFDAAGNLYAANSGFVAGNPTATAQMVQVFSPGGNTLATTSSDGTFSVEPLTNVANADFDNDGDVDGADFLTWQRGVGTAGTPSTGDADGDTSVDGDDLDVWKTQFGGSPASAVPEPASMALVLLALAGSLASQQARKQIGRRVDRA